MTFFLISSMLVMMIMIFCLFLYNYVSGGNGDMMEWYVSNSDGHGKMVFGKITDNMKYNSLNLKVRTTNKAFIRVAYIIK